MNQGDMSCTLLGSAGVEGLVEVELPNIVSDAKNDAQKAGHHMMTMCASQFR